MMIICVSLLGYYTDRAPNLPRTGSAGLVGKSGSYKAGLTSRNYANHVQSLPILYTATPVAYWRNVKLLPLLGTTLASFSGPN